MCLRLVSAVPKKISFFDIRIIVAFDPIMQFWYYLRIRIYKKNADTIFFMKKYGNYSISWQGTDTHKYTHTHGYRKN